MIFADKLIELRKKSGWSQEELAERLNVSRQSVSKWEGAQSFPDMNKIIRLSEVFSVSTDYLLKDDFCQSDGISVDNETETFRKVTMEEASDFLELKERTAGDIAKGVVMCILSPVPLTLSAVLAEQGILPVTEDFAGLSGVVVLLLIVAAAVSLFIRSGSRLSPYDYLTKECFETEYGVSSMVSQKKSRYQDNFTRAIITGVVLCILSIVPVLGAVMIDENNDLLIISGVVLMFLAIAAAVYGFVHSGLIWGSFSILLEEGDYSRSKKKNNYLSTIYWCLITAVYLGYSLISGNWHSSWVIWVIAAVIYPVVHIAGEKINK